MNIDLLRDFAHHLMGARQSYSMYPADHPNVNSSIDRVFDRVTEILRERPEIRIALVDDELVVDQRPVLADGDLLDGLARSLRGQGIGKLIIRRGVDRWEMAALIEILTTDRHLIDDAGGVRELLERTSAQHIVAGPITVGEDAIDEEHDMIADAWALYVEGLDTIRDLRSNLQEGLDDGAVQAAAGLSQSIVGLVDEAPDIFIRLQALKSHDEYSFTHSLNVALMSLSMARQMDIPRDMLTEVAMAALLHDIGKELVPDEVLNKPGKLTEEEWQVMQLHSADGAKLLLRQEPVHDLAVVVAYEHQLAYELDNPDHGRWPLHFVSQLICIADVYDALRSNRPYRASIPPDRAMQIMEEEAPKKFDRELFDGFVRMIGYYPPGTMVRLSDGSVAIADRTNPDHKDRPRVLVVRSPAGKELEPARPLDLAVGSMVHVVEVIDGDDMGIDPYDYL